MDIKIDTSEQEILFKKHIEIEGNSRIVFSGPFGSGKTTFLKNYFSKNSDYLVFHLFPVNYSVASNEDIFELIKHDLFFELLKECDFEDNAEMFSEFFLFQGFVRWGLNNSSGASKSFLEEILGELNKVGKSVFALADQIEKLNISYDKFKKDINSNEGNRIINYLKGHKKKSGSIHEEDVFTQLICKLVSQLKNKGGGKQKEIVLIVDDLDRVDPEHIFRILNIFSAHFDIDTTQNKFDFDKVILVFDENNIGNIFHNKFGMMADYSGYIDKFYSREIFSYNIAAEVEKRIIEFLGKAKSLPPVFKKANIHYQVSVYVLTSMLRARIIQIRTFTKLNNANLEISGRNIPMNSNFEVKLHIRELFEILRQIMGSYSNLDRALKRLANYENQNVIFDDLDFYHDNKMAVLLPVLDYRKHQFKPELHSGKTFYYIDNEKNLSFEYKIVVAERGNSYDTLRCNSVKIQTIDQGGATPVIPFFYYLHKTYLILKNEFLCFQE